MNAKKETQGFQLLVDAGLPEFTGEYIVMRHRSRFPPDVVGKASARLRKHDIDIPRA